MPEPLFVLCPPRSFSSLISGMIGEHPDCYGLPELALFLGDTLAESWNGFLAVRRARLAGHAATEVLNSDLALRHVVGRDGLLRTLAQLHDGAQTLDTVRRANQWIVQHSDWPVRKVFDHIQELVGGKVLVEKSPAFTRQRGYIKRMLDAFPKARILHLLRHPRGTAESVIGIRYEISRRANVSPAKDPERVWRDTHETILAITEDLPLGQCMRLKGEALLSDLDNYLPQICEWLGIRADREAITAMMHPENSPYARRGPPGAPLGNDPNYLENPALDRERLAKLKEPRLDGELSWRPGETFTPETLRLAKQFGYK
jgi:hypothetical protein